MAGARTGPSLAGRFAAAIALTVGFYTLAIAMAAALLGVAILPWVLGGSNNIWVTLTGLFLGVSILIAIFPRRLKVEPYGVRLTQASQPRLLGMIEDEARACGARAPDEVYATLELNASVMESGRRRRIMFIGVPLLHVVSERGIRGVIAHEFGHYAGGDTRLGPWIYRTHDTIGRTIVRLSDEEGDEGWTQRAVRLPFIWYGRAFMRITSAIKRRQEFAADRMAVERAGRDVHVAALRRIHAYGPSFDAYWDHEVSAVLSAGKRPPVVAGFGTFLRSASIEKAADDFLERQLAERTDPYDSHPSLFERIAAVEDCPPGDADQSQPAMALVRDPEALETEMLVAHFGPEAGELPRLAWDDVGREIYLARARSFASEHGDLLGDAVVGDLGELAQENRLEQLGGSLRRRIDDLPHDAGPALAASLLGDAFTVALAEHGWAVEARLGEPVTATRGAECLEPYGVVPESAESGTAAAGWRERAEGLGIAELPLRASAEPAPGEVVAGAREA
jgi:heat shock protein HtpX